MVAMGRAVVVLGALCVLACREQNPAYRLNVEMPIVDAATETDAATADHADTAPLDTAPPDAAPPDSAAADRLGDARTPDAAAADRPADLASDVGRTDGGVPFEYHFIECESATRFGAMARGSDPGAFGGAYVHVPVGPPDWSWNAAAPELPPDRLELPVTLAAGGTFAVWVRTWTIAVENDAWYAGFAKSDLRRHYHNASYGVWAWTRHGDVPNVLTFTGLAAGAHTLYLGRGESGPRCDRVLVTNDLHLVPTATP